ncbi:MAG: site-2 protease family protein [Gammaproteobacteria bacterium]|nr:site-2 protease family protein [Gammaproteobacteria bacterium]
MDTNKSGLHLFNLFGFEVRLDWSWFFLAILIVWTLAVGYFPMHFPNLGSNTYWIMGVVGAVGLFLSIILHELFHSLIGRYYGVPFGGITLFIFGGIAEMRDAPPSPKAELLISLAGPLLSIGLGFIFYFLFQIGTQAKWPISVNGVIRYLSVINFVLGIFNLLPGFPLDGGRILRSILWWWKGNLKWATQVACRAGVGLGFGMIFFGIFQFVLGAFISGIWAFLLGFFLQHISKMSYQDLLIRDIFQNERIKKYAKTHPITVQPDITLQDLVDNYFYKHYHKLYPVVENKKLVGCISFNEIKQIEKEQWPILKVRQVMRQCTPEIAIDVDTEVSKVLQMMTSQKISRVIVTDQGKLYGIITLKDMMDIISMKLSLEEKD